MAAKVRRGRVNNSAKATPARRISGDREKGGDFPFRTVFNSADLRTMLSRSRNPGQIDRRRDFDSECGWPRRIRMQDYLDMFERNDYASRVVSIYPDECHAVSPLIYETEKVRNTAFEKGVNAYTEFDEGGNPVDPETNLFHYWHRVDVVSGICRFGALMLGIDDGRDLDQPADGLTERGETITGVPERKLLFMRALDESMVKVKNYETNTKNPRYGRPKMYTLRLANLTVDSDFFDSDRMTRDQDVHWTRVIHVADNRTTSEIFGVPRMRPVFNRLLDTHKVLGSAAEMFYQGGFPGLALTLDPTLLTAGLPEVDESSIDEQMYLYMNRLQRYLHLVGYEAKSLAPNIADPKGHLEGLLQAIATAIGVPLRIFLGAEQAQLASGQDVRTWNRRLLRRQNRYLTPMLVRPTIDRLIALGVLPRPKRGLGSYRVVWPDVNIPNPDELSTVADRNASSIMKYMQSAAWQMIHPATFFRLFLGKTADEVAVIMEELKTMPKIELKTLQQLAPPKAVPAAGGKSKPGSSGVKGRSNSKPPRGGRTQ